MLKRYGVRVPEGRLVEEGATSRAAPKRRRRISQKERKKLRLGRKGPDSRRRSRQGRRREGLQRHRSGQGSRSGNHRQNPGDSSDRRSRQEGSQGLDRRRLRYRKELYLGIVIDRAVSQVVDDGFDRRRDGDRRGRRAHIPKKSSRSRSIPRRATSHFMAARSPRRSGSLPEQTKEAVSSSRACTTASSERIARWSRSTR